MPEPEEVYSTVLLEHAKEFLVETLIPLLCGERGKAARDLLKTRRVDSSALRILSNLGATDDRGRVITELSSILSDFIDSLQKNVPQALNGLESRPERKIEILEEVARAGPIRVRDLASITLVPKSTLYRYIKELEGLGLLEKDSNPTVTISEEGQRLLETIEQHSRSLAHAIAKEISTRPGFYVLRRGKLMPQRIPPGSLLLRVTRGGEVIPVR